MNRLQTLDAMLLAALHDPSLTFTGVAKTIHRTVPEVKQVAVVKRDQENTITISVLFHDHERLNINLFKMSDEELLGDGEREVVREADDSLTLH